MSARSGSAYRFDCAAERRTGGVRQRLLWVGSAWFTGRVGEPRSRHPSPSRSFRPTAKKSLARVLSASSASACGAMESMAHSVIWVSARTLAPCRRNDAPCPGQGLDRGGGAVEGERRRQLGGYARWTPEVCKRSGQGALHPLRAGRVQRVDECAWRQLYHARKWPALQAAGLRGWSSPGTPCRRRTAPIAPA